MKILITGSLGLVGSACVELFEEKGWEVVGIDNNNRHKTLGTPSKTGAFEVDITDQIQIYALFRAHKFDAIIHAAGQPSHDYSKDHPWQDFHTNTVGTLNLLEATRVLAPEATFVYVSSDKVYGGNMEREDLVELDTRYDSRLLLNEEIPLDQAAHSPFGCAKAAADLYVQEYGFQYGIKTACFRCGCITGKNHEGAELHGFLAYLTKCIKEEIPYTIFGHKGKQVRDQIHATDLANAFWHFIQNPLIAQVYNMGGGRIRSVSVLEAGELLSKKLNKPFVYQIKEEARKSDLPWHIHDVFKFINDYPDWDYQYSLDDILNDLCTK